MSSTSSPATLEACVAYALGRPPYVVRWVTSTVRAQWASLPVGSRTRILGLVEDALTTSPTRTGRSARVWEDLAWWGRWHLDDPVGGVPELEGGLMPSAVRAVLTGLADEQAEDVWEDLARVWPDLMTATRQVGVVVVVGQVREHHLAVYAPTDPEATDRVARLLVRTGHAQQASRLLALVRDGQAG